MASPTIQSHGDKSFVPGSGSFRTKIILAAILVLLPLGLPLLGQPVEALSSPNPSLSSPGGSKVKVGITRDFASLQKWASQNGVVLADGVSFEKMNEHDDDWAITVQQSKAKKQKSEKASPVVFQAGSVVMNVPKKLVMSSPDILAELGGEASLQDAFDILERANLGSHRSEFLLFLKVLIEVALGPESFWYTWIQSLPKRFATGVCYDEVELECLPPFSRALADYERMKLQVFGLAASKVPCVMLDQRQQGVDQVIATDLNRWAFNVVYSRCWQFSDDLESGISDIVPIGDLFNHREPATISVRNDKNADTVDFVLMEDVSVDESSVSDRGLYLSYGLTNPHRFLVMFGFVDPSMPEIFCQLVFPEPTEEHVALGCADRSKMVYRTEDGAIANAVWDSILYALLAQEPEQQAALVKSHAQGNGGVKASLHATYALETALTLKMSIAGTVKELENLMRQIDQAMDKDGNEQHLNLPLIRTHNDFLWSVFAKVQARLDDTIEKEKRRRLGR